MGRLCDGCGDQNSVKNGMVLMIRGGAREAFGGAHEEKREMNEQEIVNERIRPKDECKERERGENILVCESGPHRRGRAPRSLG